jgi:hypothetical protein
MEEVGGEVGEIALFLQESGTDGGTSLEVSDAKTKTGSKICASASRLGKRCWQRPSRGAREQQVSFLLKLLEFLVELEFVVVEFIFSLLEGVHPK